MAELVKDQMLEDEMAKDEMVEDEVDINPMMHGGSQNIVGIKNEEKIRWCFILKIRPKEWQENSCFVLKSASRERFAD